jgi:hypothetical protein
VEKLAEATKALKRMANPTNNRAATFAVDVIGYMAATGAKVVYVEQAGGDLNVDIKHAADDSVKVLKEAMNGLSQLLQCYLDAPVSVLQNFESFAIQLIGGPMVGILF